MKYYIVDATELEALSLPVRGAWIEMYEVEANCKGDNTSLPVRGAWIEIAWQYCKRTPAGSLPVRGAWIEMILPVSCRFFPVSLPVRGAWIEIIQRGELGVPLRVAPRAGSVD